MRIILLARIWYASYTRRGTNNSMESGMHVGTNRTNPQGQPGTRKIGSETDFCEPYAPLFLFVLF